MSEVEVGEVRPHWRSGDFWLTMIQAGLVGVAVAWDGEKWALVLEFLAMALMAMGYGRRRKAEKGQV